MNDNINKIDILDREPFVQLLYDLIETYKENKQSGNFAVYGDWGAGKSFVLEKLEERLSDNKEYIVIPYNVWDYDYYDEPLVALLISIKDMLIQKKIVSNTEEFIKKEISSVFKTLIKTGSLIDPTNVIAYKFIETAVERVEGVKKDWEEHKKSIKIDNNVFIKDALEKFQKTLKDIAKEKKIVIIIDELDRCLPHYQIKVLERMHHLLKGQNSICVYAINEKQLQYTEKSIYGDKVDLNGYMKKFIDYNFELVKSKVNDRVMERHNDIIKMFQYKEDDKDNAAIKELIQVMLSGLNIRTQEKIWEKLKLLHKIAFKKYKKTSTLVLGIEIMILAMLERQGGYIWKKNDKENAFGKINIERSLNKFLTIHTYNDENISKDMERLFIKYENILNGQVKYQIDRYENRIAFYIVDYMDIIELKIIYLWYAINEEKDIKWIDFPESIESLATPIRKFYEMAEKLQDRH